MNTYTYHLLKPHYLDYYLYLVSISKVIKRRKMRSWILAIAVWIIIAIVVYVNGDNPLPYLLLSAISGIAYPLFYRWRYLNFYSKKIDSNYGGNAETEITITLGKNDIKSFDGSSTATVKHTDLDSIFELKNQIIMNTKKGEALIIAKDFDALPVVKNYLKNVAKNNRITWTDSCNWKW